MLSSSQIISCFRNIIVQYKEKSSTQQSIESLDYTSQTININWSEESKTTTKDIQTIVRNLLSLHAPLCDPKIPAKTLIAHLTMLAPSLPLDCIPLFQEAIYGNLSSIDELLEKLTAIEQRAELRKQKKDGISWNIDFDTHIGKRKALVGQTNQDYFYMHQDGENLMFVVADGISICTAGSGNLASHIAVQVINHLYIEEKNKVQNMSLQEIEVFLCQILQNANYNICETAKNLSPNGIEEEIPMGSTIVLGYAKGTDVVLASLGDSRAYLLTEDGPAILTGDHNVRGERIRARLPPDPSSNGNALIRYLGHFNEDYESSLPKPEIRHFQVIPGERLLICSDGYTDYAATHHDDLSTLIMEASTDNSLAHACHLLVRQANAGGGGDNITVLLAELSVH